MGAPFKPEVNNSPPVGGYDVNENPIISKSQSAIIKPPTSPYRRPAEKGPEVGNAALHKSWS